jgi:hypothetical protein
MKDQNPFKDNLETLRLDAKPASAGAQTRQLRTRRPSRHIGCPLTWFKRVFPIVRGKNELAVALFLYRQHAIHRSRTITLSNACLAELGIERHAKYRALRRLAGAGIITLERYNKSAARITFCRHRKSTR